MVVVLDVLIAGAGPAGLCFAAESRLHGVEVTVVERRAAPDGQSRAGGMQAGTLDTFATRGLAERFIEGRHPGADRQTTCRVRTGSATSAREIPGALAPQVTASPINHSAPLAPATRCDCFGGPPTAVSCAHRTGSLSCGRTWACARTLPREVKEVKLREAMRTPACGAASPPLSSVARPWFSSPALELHPAELSSQGTRRIKTSGGGLRCMSICGRDFACQDERSCPPARGEPS
ncbi:FAD-dependent monooxygenase [Streptomyces cinnamoneus]|uniref:FAD-dependent monooxygenase n=1 Tax=Streptomyces cinnamoneus TaxID=53446 RepID=UPI0037B770B7